MSSDYQMLFVRHSSYAHSLGPPGSRLLAEHANAAADIARCAVCTEQERGRSPTHRLPITPELLLWIRKVWEKDAGGYDIIMLWAACTTCFFGFFRADEITTPSDRAFSPSDHLTFSDVAVDCVKGPTVLRIRLKRSKTDPFCRGIDVYIGRTNNKLCPVAAMMAYLSVRGGGLEPFSASRTVGSSLEKVSSHT